jgi:hypothetical protein
MTDSPQLADIRAWVNGTHPHADHDTYAFGRDFGRLLIEALDARPPSMSVPTDELPTAARALLDARAALDEVQSRERSAAYDAAGDAFREVNRSKHGRLLPFDATRDLHEARLIVALDDMRHISADVLEALARPLVRLASALGVHCEAVSGQPVGVRCELVPGHAGPDHQATLPNGDLALWPNR